MRKTLCAVLAALMLAALLPLGAFAKAASPAVISTETLIDTDGSDGYSGDYVVIYNPSTNSSSKMSTGNMAGLIKTELDQPISKPTSVSDDGAYVIDVDGKLAEQAREIGLDKAPRSVRNGKGISFEVGDTNTFTVLNYNPLPSYYVEFEVLAKGEHCYIWTPTSTAANVWPLDVIDPDFAQIAADTFDSKFDLMQQSFGDHDNGSDGDGRLNILYYNIDDGWQPGQGYVAGYFSAYDLYVNGMPILNIDTYPGVHYEDPEGNVTNDISRTFNTMVHEYQHLINYSECGYTDTWINECMSAAAEEICFPGSSVYPRIQTWINHSYKENEDWFNPPMETEYNPDFTLQNGFSMYDWDNNIEISDILVLYAQVSLFAQYIYTHHGNTFFRSLLEQLANGSSFISAYQNLTGGSASDFVAGYRVALTANTTQDEYDGRYGFIMQQGYDPEDYYGVENLYNLLCPVVFTGNTCQIAGGGAICVKPVNGVYYPPAGAASGLKYYGVTRTCPPQSLTPIHEVHIMGFDIPPLAGEESADHLICWADDDEGYTFHDIMQWYENDQPFGGTFTAGNQYSVGVTLEAEPGYCFAADCVVYINGKTEYADPEYCGALPDDDTLLAVRSIPMQPHESVIVVDEIHINGFEYPPVAGENADDHVALTIEEGAPYFFFSAGDLAWYNADLDNDEFFHGAFELGTNYSMFVPIGLLYGYEFADEVTVYINGETGLVSENTFNFTTFYNFYTIPFECVDESGFLMGDVDGNGSVTANDALMALRASLGLIELTPEQFARADVIQNGTVNANDALWILRRSLGLV